MPEQSPLPATSPLEATVVIVVAVVTVIGLSVLQGAYHLDPHHWGLILSNAIDLDRGRVPYREVFIQYGILSAVLPEWFYRIGGTQLSIIAGVAAFYAVGIAGTYFISREVSARRDLAIFTFITALLVHPLAIYPWPNYIAFPFLIFGTLLVLKAERAPWMGFLAGVLLGLAVLCRESLLPVAAIALLILPALEFWCSGDLRKTTLRLLSWVGFVLPLVLFAFYLVTNGLSAYWWQTAVELPKLYVEVFLPNGVTGAALKLIVYLLPIAPLQHSPQFVIALVLMSAAYFCLLALARSNARKIGTGMLFVAVLTGMAASSSLHINEIFRLATSVLLGTALLYSAADRFKSATPAFLFCTCILVVGMFQHGNGNYFLPTRAQIKSGTTSDTLPVFAGQRWTPDVYDYYGWYNREMQNLAARKCGLRYIENDTRDAYLEALSPFIQHQLMPYGSAMLDRSFDEAIRRLRPDYDPERRRQSRDMVIVTSRQATSKDTPSPLHDRLTPRQFAQSSVPINPAPPPGYVEHSSRVSPRSYFMPDGFVTLIWIPASCT